MKKARYMFGAIMMALMTVMPAQAQDRYLMSTAPIDASYINVPEQWKEIIAPATIDTIVAEIETNMVLSASNCPIWLKVKQLDGNHLQFAFKASTSSAVRTATITLKGLDGNTASVKVSQLGKSANVLLSKKILAIYSDKSFDSLAVVANLDYEVKAPDWVTVTKTGDNLYSFTAEPIYDQEMREGNIEICNTGGDVLQTVPFTQYYEEACWYEKPLFAVVSDIHFGDTNCQTSVKRWPRWFKTINNYKPGLNAIVVIGDLADQCQEWQYDSVRTIFNTYMNPSIRKIIIRGNHDNFKSAGPELFTKYIGQPFNQYIELKGYPLITLGNNSSAYNYDPSTNAYNSTNPATTKCYNDATIAFLEASLADAVKKYPGKPVFVFSHCLVTNTIKGSMGSWRADDMQLRPIFDKYPQVIHFSGHTHVSVGVEENAAQPSFVAVNDGAHKNNSFNGPGHYQKDADKEVDYDAITEGLVVRIDKDDNVIMERWNTTRGTKYKNDWVVEYPFDGVNRSLAARNGGKAPWWKDGSITISEMNGTSCLLSFKQAEDDQEVYKYHINVANSSGTKVRGEIKQLALCHWGDKKPAVLQVPLNDLPQGVSLTVSIVPYDAFSQAGSALTKTFTLP